MEDPFIVKPCKEKGALEAIPKRERYFNLKRLLGILLSKGYELKVDTPFVLVVKKDKEISIFPSGRLLIKSSDPEEVKKLAKEIYDLVN
jgi:hypothetical protein